MLNLEKIYARRGYYYDIFKHQECKQLVSNEPIELLAEADRMASERLWRGHVCVPFDVQAGRPGAHGRAKPVDCPAEERLASEARRRTGLRSVLEVRARDKCVLRSCRHPVRERHAERRSDASRTFQEQWPCEAYKVGVGEMSAPQRREYLKASDSWWMDGGDEWLHKGCGVGTCVPFSNVRASRPVGRAGPFPLKRAHVRSETVGVRRGKAGLEAAPHGPPERAGSQARDIYTLLKRDGLLKITSLPTN
ncbi:hypothetical protein HAX54_039871 [Datura stramonium]|uniref:Uncharacterized protein n=1 Tax=Datura stramonium TaxID=4076 RepID=A0ABS8VPU4_DATST|nr:hypothetical protein [Datura stramonium]